MIFVWDENNHDFIFNANVYKIPTNGQIDVDEYIFIWCHILCCCFHWQRKEKIRAMNKAQDRKKSDFKQGKVFGVGNSCKTFQNGHSKSYVVQ